MLLVGIPPRTDPISSEKETVSVVCLSVACPSLTDTFNFPLMLQTLEQAESERTITHMFYTAWPDHGVPYNTMSLVSFIRRVRDQHPPSRSAPLLVHCSAGVGRTGTFILLDLATQQMRREGTLSMFNSLQSMRNQRMKMVQTLVSV